VRRSRPLPNATGLAFPNTFGASCGPWFPEHPAPSFRAKLEPLMAGAAFTLGPEVFNRDETFE
jgi:hypothetical protein